MSRAPATNVRVSDTAARLFRRQGYTATGITQIAGAAGATVGSIYHFFPGGKADLAEHAIRDAGASYRNLVAGVLNSAEDPEAAILLMFGTAAEALVDSDYADACPLATVALEVASTDQRLREAVDAVFGDWLDTATAWMNRWVPEPVDRELARSMIMLLEGAFLLAQTSRDTTPLQTAGTSMVALLRAHRGFDQEQRV